MPTTYDYNGSVATKIAKIYDYNGSAATELKNAYDNDGSTSRLVFNSETQVFPGTAPSVLLESYSGTYTANTTSWTAKTGAAANNQNSSVLGVTLNMSNISKIQVNYSLAAGSGVTAVMLISKSVYDSGPKYPYYFIYSQNQTEINKWAWILQSGTSATYTNTSLTGNYYLLGMAYMNNSSGAAASYTITKVITTPK